MAANVAVLSTPQARPPLAEATAASRERRTGLGADTEQRLLAFLLLPVIPLPQQGILLLRQKEEVVWCLLARRRTKLSQICTPNDCEQMSHR